MRAAQYGNGILPSWDAMHESRRDRWIRQAERLQVALLVFGLRIEEAGQ